MNPEQWQALMTEIQERKAVYLSKAVQAGMAGNLESREFMEGAAAALDSVLLLLRKHGAPWPLATVVRDIKTA